MFLIFVFLLRIYLSLDFDLEVFFEAAEDWNSAMAISNSMAFISQFGEVCRKKKFFSEMSSTRLIDCHPFFFVLMCDLPFSSLFFLSNKNPTKNIVQPWWWKGSSIEVPHRVTKGGTCSTECIKAHH